MESTKTVGATPTFVKPNSIINRKKQFFSYHANLSKQTSEVVLQQSNRSPVCRLLFFSPKRNKTHTQRHPQNSAIHTTYGSYLRSKIVPLPFNSLQCNKTTRIGRAPPLGIPQLLQVLSAMHQTHPQVLPHTRILQINTLPADRVRFHPMRRMAILQRDQAIGVGRVRQR